MKKLILAVFIFVFSVGVACADWTVTVNWTHSPNADLKNEKVFLDGVEQCDVLAADTATCPFVVTDLTGQVVTLQAFNSQDTGSAIYDAGTLLAIPEPPSGAIITITVIP